MGNPSAALVPTAWRTGTLHQVMNGTDRNAPPAPSNPDAKPMPAPTAVWPARPGSCRPGRGGRSRSMRSAVQPMKTAKNSASPWPLSSANAPAPAARPPSTMPGASVAASSQRTAPSRWCSRTLDSDVNRIVAIEVAMAIFTA
jgi:hypothetical protein